MRRNALKGRRRKKEGRKNEGMYKHMIDSIIIIIIIIIISSITIIITLESIIGEQ